MFIKKEESGVLVSNMIMRFLTNGILLMCMTLCVGAKPSTFCNEPDDHLIKDWRTGLEGSWKQALSSYFLVSTDLVDMDCLDLDVVVKDDPVTIHVHQSSIQHQNPSLKVETSYLLTNASWNNEYWLFNNTKHRPGFWLRCVKTYHKIEKNTTAPLDLAIWTGTDNLSMMVWVRDVDEFNKKYINNVTAYLSMIDFVGRYKQPILTYNESICHRHGSEGKNNY